MAVTEAELEALLRRHKWTISRSKTGRQKAFAAKRGPAKQRESRYIGTSSTLRAMTEEDVLARLNRPKQQSS